MCVADRGAVRPLPAGASDDTALHGAGRPGVPDTRSGTGICKSRVKIAACPPNHLKFVPMILKKPLLLIPLTLTLLHVACYGQDKWDLTRCVNYALANNISIKQSDIQARLAKLT